MLGHNDEEPKLEEVDINDPKKNKGGFHFPWTALIIFGVLAILIAVCAVFIIIFGGPIVD